MTLEQARAARDELRRQIGKPSWLRGLGISAKPQGDHFVQVNVDRSTRNVERLVPARIRGVEVKIEAVGDVEAR